MSSLPHPVGHKVVCIHGTFASRILELFSRAPRENHVYTISEVFWESECGTGGVTLNVRLTELPPIRPGLGGFPLWRFRLLEDVKILRRDGLLPARSHREC